ncbi:MAG: acetyl-CoA hydrolase/transferase C-terminal domain-containing protein [Actinomycetota bacterium]
MTLDPSLGAMLDRVDTLVLADGADGADIVPGMLAAEGRLGGGAVAGRRVVVGWLPGDRVWTDALAGADALMGGYGVRGAIREARAVYRPVRLSAVPGFLAGLPRPIATVVRGRPVGDGFVFGGSVGWGPAAAALADVVVVEVDPAGPGVSGPVVPGNVIAVVEGTATPVPPRVDAVGAVDQADAVDRVIAANVARVLPAEPTIQYGPGTLLDTVVRHLDRPVGLFSGLATDAVVELAATGRLRDTAVAGYLWGGDALADLARDGRLRLAPSTETHDPARLAALPQFVALNTALEVGLDGAVNVERLGADVVGGVGGHPDFARGASACPDGVSVVVCRSAYRGRSTIVPRPRVTTTARTDVDVVVTEHGVADLRGRSDEERARLLVEIAHPDHREALARGDDPHAGHA